MNLMIEYTDVHYASKQEVADALGKHLADPVWNQLLDYRKSYMVKTELVDFCLCPGILKKTVEFYELTSQLKTTEMSHIESMFQDSDSLWMFQHYVKTAGPLKERIHDVCMQFHSNHEQTFLALMDHHELPFPAKIVVILMLSSMETSVLLLGICLNHFGLTQLFTVIDPSDLKTSFQKDGTALLEQLLLLWTNRIRFLLQKTNNDKMIKMNHLVYQYPQLKAYQIDFYLSHHEPGFYYTIEQFIECSGVCYETGRCALKQMVDLGFYQMFKQGKKFVYTAR